MNTADGSAGPHELMAPVVIADEERFKIKLGIGDALLQKLKARDHLSTVAEAMGVGTTASAVAASTTVASVLAPSPAAALGVTGLATFATPLPWIVGAGLAAGSAYIGVANWLSGDKKDKGLVIPKNSGTPLDLVGASLLDLMLPLSLSFATDEDLVRPDLERTIRDYFVAQWGYSPEYYELVRAAVSRSHQEGSADRLASALLEFSNSSADCHTPALLSDFECHLDSLLAAHSELSKHAPRLEILKVDIFRRFGQKPSRLQQFKSHVSLTRSKVTQKAQKPFYQLRDKVTAADERLRAVLSPFR